MTIAIILIVAVGGFVAYKFLAGKKKAKQTPKKATKPSRPKRGGGGATSTGGSHTNGGSYYSGKR